MIQTWPASCLCAAGQGALVHHHMPAGGYSLGGLLAVFACEKALLGTPPERFIEEAHGW